MPLSCALVGATSLLPLPAISIQAVCDPSEPNGKALAAALECPWYASPEDMLTAKPGLEILWLRPDGTGQLPFDPVKLASFGRHLVPDLSLPLTVEQFSSLLSVSRQKGAQVHVVFPPIPDLPPFGELYSLEVRGRADAPAFSPLDQLPFCLNQGLALLLALGGSPSRLQGSFDRSASARLGGPGGPDKIGLQMTFSSGAIGQFLLLPATKSEDPGWSVTLTGSEGSCSFSLPTDGGPVWSGGHSTPNGLALYPVLLSLRKAVSSLLHPYN